MNLLPMPNLLIKRHVSSKPYLIQSIQASFVYQAENDMRTSMVSFAWCKMRAENSVVVCAMP